MSDAMFYKGDHVLYVPTHARGNTTHPDCQRGVVSSVRPEDRIAFVKYDCPACTMVTGDEPYTAQGTDFDDLRHRLR
jgi:hypothetical protein